MTSLIHVEKLTVPDSSKLKAQHKFCVKEMKKKIGYILFS